MATPPLAPIGAPQIDTYLTFSLARAGARESESERTINSSALRSSSTLVLFIAIVLLSFSFSLTRLLALDF